MNSNIKIRKHQEDVIPSEGEACIKLHLDNEEIKNIFQYDILNLEHDNCSYRTADFYLPRIKMFVEFYGGFNIDKASREKYRKKTRVYKKNGLPCIFLYPENLGNIDFTFHYRLMRTMKLHGMKRQLLRYKFNKLYQDNRNLIALNFYLPTLIILAIFTLNTGLPPETNFLVLIGALVGIGIGFKRLYYRHKEQKFISKSYKRNIPENENDEYYRY